MKRRNFCRILSLLPLATALPRASWGAVPASAEQVLAYHQQLDALCREFEQLKFPQFSMNLDENLQRIPGMSELESQAKWIAAARAKLPVLPSEFPAELEARLDSFKSDLEFLGEWNSLSQIYRRNPKEILPSRGYAAMSAEEQAAIQKLQRGGANCVYLTNERWKGLVCLDQGERWYDLYARFWTSLPNANACQPVELAQKALSRCESELARLGRTLGVSDLKTLLASSAMEIIDEKQVVSEFQALDRKVRQLKLMSLDCPPVNFARMPKDNPTRAPGFYRQNTFYYDFWDTFPKQNLVWLYLHEALPGHHAQMSHQQRSDRPRLLNYPGMMEGWGVYAEHLGAENGLMDDPIQQLGWVLWDQVRSARVYLDWQIHRQGWTRGQAMDWWKKNVPLQEDRALTEVRRVVEWPGQSLSYKIGEEQLLRLRETYRTRLGDRFRQQDFHNRILTTPYSSWSELFQYL